MSYITSEYTVLINQGEGEDVTIKPYTEFEGFNGSYKVASYATVKDAKSGDIVAVLQPGQLVDGVGKLKESPFQDLPLKDLKQLCIDASISFKSKATRAELIDLLQG